MQVPRSRPQVVSGAIDIHEDWMQRQFDFDPWNDDGFGVPDPDPFNDDTIIEGQCDLENPAVCESCT